MICNIRGTHGSGKSTIVLKILNKFPHESLSEGKKIAGYLVHWDKPLYVVGSYHTACGGCDGVQPYDLIWPRVEEYAKLGHVLFEGALISSCMGSIVQAMVAKKDCVVAFLDTPLDECLRRIEKRRAAKGDFRPLNPKNTTVKFEGILRSRPKMEALGLKCVTIPHRSAVSYVLAILRGAK